MDKKKKRDFFATLEAVERYHRRRSIFVMHLVLSLAFQIAVWGNWFASYAQYGRGFEGNFFADRFLISIALLLFLAGHLAVMTMLESKDKLSIQAIRLLAQRQHEDEIDDSDYGGATTVGS